MHSRSWGKTGPLGGWRSSDVMFGRLPLRRRRDGVMARGGLNVELQSWFRWLCGSGKELVFLSFVGLYGAVNVVGTLVRTASGFLVTYVSMDELLMFMEEIFVGGSSVLIVVRCN